MKNRLWLFALLLVAPILASQPAKALVTILYLSVDVSGSISTSAFNTQRAGWAAAITDLANQGNYFTPNNQVWIAYDYFATEPGALDLGFTLLDSSADGVAFANQIAATSRPGNIGSSTGINDALATANDRILTFIDDEDIDVDNIVIDISFDGFDNVDCGGTSGACPTLQTTTAGIVANTIPTTINVIAVNDPAGGGSATIPQLIAYSNTNLNPTLVFSANLNETDAFVNEAREKLQSELVPAPLPAAALLPLMGIGRYVRRTRKKLAALR